MSVVITGATGMIGRAVAAALADRGEPVVALSRDRDRARSALGDRVEVHEWRDPVREPPPADALRGAGAVVHLLGARIDQRWTPSAKRAIRDSRVETTRRLVDALRALPDGERPAVLVSQSATGYYGPSDERPLAEDAPPGDDFLAGFVQAWEAEALRAAPALRVAVTRTGVVLSPDGGALGRMLPFFRLGVGGPVAGGRQYLPWVHLDDVVAALLRCVDDERVSGPINVTAPQATTNREFSRALGRVLHRPAVLPVPAFALRALYGEMAHMVLTGQHAVPRRLQALGHEFRQPELEPALRDVLA
ncbi:MAG TPA: TIGR01777 family oxidoreductase [Solirubrobacter sp.]|nr:TIGR01777 family oxidoreductase [Solirubrobacter sp.]